MISSTTCPTLTLSAPDAQTLTGSTTPLQTADYYREKNGVTNPKILSFQEVDGKHGYKYLVAPVLPTWQFASTDPTSGQLSSLECDVAPDNGWHSYVRSSGTASTITHSKVTVTGGRNAAKENIYTVFNGQQLIAALNEAALKPKIVRVVGHIDLRYSNSNTTFKEYISYTDQKYGGSINIPSNTTLVGINDASGKPARITGTTLLIGGELGTTTDVIAGAVGDPEADFKKWIAAGKDGDLYPTWTRNIIIRNLKIDTPWDVDPEDSGNGYADGVTISRAQNIWVDHVTISDGDTPDTLASDTRHDGALDIVRGSDYVTLANSFFGDHGKNTLVGNGDSGRAWSDENRLHVTFTGLWWKGIASRHPLTRFSQLHSYNNLMDGVVGTVTYGHKFEGGLDVRYQSSVFAENNFHLFTGLKTTELCGKIIGGKDGKGFRTSGNYFIADKYNTKDWALAWTGPINVDSTVIASACSELPATDIAWTPPYSYTAVCAPQARRNVEVNTGAGRIGLNAVLGTQTDAISSNSCYESNVLGSASSSSSSAASSAAASSSAASSDASSSAAASSSASGGSGTTITYPWSDDFAVASATTLFTTTYAKFTNSSGAEVAMYAKTGGTFAVADGVITMTGGRFTIGALTTTGTTSASTGPLGIFNIVGKACTLTVNASQAGSGSGKFLVYVDNNTTSGGNSPHATSTLTGSHVPSATGSVVVSLAATSLVAGDNVFTWTLTNASYTGGSFLQIRTESSTIAYINSISLSCL